ncbi:hypothetical protein GTV56_08990 [Campylobacter jejuni]|nr:hypothetical protein [Campylobacter jejuni]EDO7429486.1 hypothetical protein [Campylobacter jejuni]EDO7476024.1 hypothetical protein [Campylobacter jejuni]EDO8488916.1 hypothetical protein [Campylobacter jejuni]EDO8489830.1 hypothetical protein [Campylobacter jejuni]
MFQNIIKYKDFIIFILNLKQNLYLLIKINLDFKDFHTKVLIFEIFYKKGKR